MEEIRLTKEEFEKTFYLALDKLEKELDLKKKENNKLTLWLAGAVVAMTMSDILFGQEKESEQTC